MATVTLTINGKEVQAPAGSTVLEAARLAGIDIPTLCDHPSLKPVGACRLCLVDIEGQRALQPSCTFPISEGLKVETESEKVVKSRRFVLELLLTERNHYCMFCEASGDCELQSLAYRYGLESWPYPAYYRAMPVDASRAYFVMDHNRCILCRRCARACAELSGNHTLGVKGRGAESLIIADLDEPLGQSSCISCGSCLQVCPTGALFDRRSAYMSRDYQAQRVRTSCVQCSLGCAAEVVTRANHVLRIEGDYDSPPSNGLLCELGRFAPIYNVPDERIPKPMIRQGEDLREASWEEALQVIGERLGGRGLAAGASTRATDETLALFGEVFLRGLGAQVGSLDGALPEIGLESQGTIADLLASDCILVAEADPTLGAFQVAGCFIKRAIHEGARAILIEGKPKANLYGRAHMVLKPSEAAKAGLRALAYKVLKPSQAAQGVAICQEASQPAVVYDGNLSPQVAKALKALEGVANFVRLAPGTNSVGAAKAKLGEPFRPQGARAAFVMACDDGSEDQALAEGLKGMDFVAVHAAYHGPLTQVAHVVLPARLWSEKEGNWTAYDGQTRRWARAVNPPEGVKDDQEMLLAVAERLEVKV